jgi:hypothetical protein
VLCRKKNSPLRESVREMPHIMPWKEMNASSTFPIDEVLVPVRILRRQPLACKGLCVLQEK